MLLALDNIYNVIDTGSSTVLVSLNLSAAFDTLEHSVLLNRLQNSFGITGLALAWFQSYLSDCHQFGGGSRSSETPCCMDVAQGSVLGPMLFSLYIAPIAHIVSSFGLLKQQYADDTQLYVAISKDNHFLALNQLEHCLVILHTWFCHNGLALNPDKSDAIIFGTAQRTRYLPNLSTVDVAGAIVPISDHIKLLGVTLDSRLAFNTHISAVEIIFFRYSSPPSHPFSTYHRFCQEHCMFSHWLPSHLCQCNPGRHRWQEYEAHPAYPEHVGSSGYTPVRPH